MMRTVTIQRNDTGERREIKVRALKRKEIRALGELGYNYLGCVPTYEKAEDAVDQALGFVLTGEDQAFLDECDNREVTAVWKALLKETYGDKDEEKNLPATTGGTSTQSA